MHIFVLQRPKKDDLIFFDALILSPLQKFSVERIVVLVTNFLLIKILKGAGKVAGKEKKERKL